METMISPDRALELVLNHAEPLSARDSQVIDSIGLVLAEPIHADRDYPPFDRAMMDGYAMCVADAGRTVPVVGTLAAGKTQDTPLAPGTALEIMTGAPCPPGTGAVIQKERVTLEGDRVALPAGVKPGLNIMPRAAECAEGTLLLSPGTVINQLAVANMASVGRATIKVHPMPSVGIISTGDELVTHAEQPGPGKIRDSNGPMLVAACRSMGLTDVVHLFARDNPMSLKAALSKVADKALIILNGGVSAGRFDLVPPALAALGAETIFHRVTQRPGKPMLFACNGPQLIFGLPGNPLSSHLCFHRYVKAVLRCMMGRAAAPPEGHGALAADVEVSGDRTLFAIARVARSEQSFWRVEVVRGKGSADIFSAVAANAIVRLEPAQSPYRAGTEIGFEWIHQTP